MRKLFLLTVSLSIWFTCQTASGQDTKTYTIKSTYASTETCNYKTDGIYIVWWDKNSDYSQQATEILNTLMDVSNDCLNTYKMSDPPNPLAGYFYNVYIHNGKDIFKPQGWGYNVYKINNSMAATYTFQILGDKTGSESAPAAFRGRVVVRTGSNARQYDLKMADAFSGKKEVKVKATDAEVYLVVAATPEYFRGNQRYSYVMKIEKK